ncbi:MAG: accessory gene regulator ArgB-like protein [Eubacterium sp.]
MFRYLSENITFLLIKNKVLDIKDRDIYIYGIETILLNASILIAVLIVSILGNNLYHFCGFIIFFVPLRVFVGGYHAKNSEMCFMLSIGVYTITLFIIKYWSEIFKSEIAIVFSIIAVIIIIVWSPLKNPNHPLAEYQYRRNKRIVYGIIVVDFVLFTIFYKYNSVMASGEVIFVILVSFFVLIGKIEYKKLKANMN